MEKIKTCEVCGKAMKPQDYHSGCEECGKMFGPCCESADDGDLCVACA
jgi:hypothetical protein